VSAIRVGDLVYVVRQCCGEDFLGVVRNVSLIGRVMYPTCARCGFVSPVGTIAAMLDGIHDYGFHLDWLRKIDPPAEQERVERGEEIVLEGF
jgi:hypothetical protein